MYGNPAAGCLIVSPSSLPKASYSVLSSWFVQSGIVIDVVALSRDS